MSLTPLNLYIVPIPSYLRGNFTNLIKRGLRTKFRTQNPLGKLILFTIRLTRLMWISKLISIYAISKFLHDIKKRILTKIATKHIVYLYFFFWRISIETGKFFKVIKLSENSFGGRYRVPKQIKRKSCDTYAEAFPPFFSNPTFQPFVPYRDLSVVSLNPASSLPSLCLLSIWEICKTPTRLHTSFPPYLCRHNFVLNLLYFFSFFCVCYR